MARSIDFILAHTMYTELNNIINEVIYSSRIDNFSQ